MSAFKKLSPPQRAMLERLSKGSERTPFTGGRNAGQVASAWYRTAQSLMLKGHVVLEREGDGQRAHLTVHGVAALGAKR